MAFPSPAPDLSADWTKEKLAALLVAATHAIERSRYVFIVLNVVGVCVVASLFNGMAPWMRHIVSRAGERDPAELNSFKKLLREDLNIISAPLIGLKFSVYDLSIIGATALLIIAIWQYYCARRENHVVNVICSEAQEQLQCGNQECARYLYHGLAYNFVFTTRFRANQPAGTNAKPEPTFIVAALFFMPAWIPILVVITDVASLLMTCTYCSNPADRSILFLDISVFERTEAVLRMSYALVLGGISWFYCCQGINYERGTRQDIDSLRSLIENPEPRRPKLAT